jgi:hypothetical protein
MYGTIAARASQRNRGDYLGFRELYLVPIIKRKLQTLPFRYFLAPVKPASSLNGAGSTIQVRAHEETGLAVFWYEWLKTYTCVPLAIRS